MMDRIQQSLPQTCYGVLYSLVLLYLALVLACAGPAPGTRPQRGVYHQVQNGETIAGIARLYKVSEALLAAANHLRSTDRLEAGRIIFVPGPRYIPALKPPPAGTEGAGAGPGQMTPAYKGESEDKAALKKGEAPAPAPALPPEKQKEAKTPRREAAAEKKRPLRNFPDNLKDIPLPAPPAKEPERTQSGGTVEGEKKAPLEKKRFLFPLEGKVISRFGLQPNGLYFNGIKIAAPAGTLVKAADDGLVIFSDAHPLKDYGQAIIIKHEGNYITVYANLDKRLVKRDDRVKRGSAIAAVVTPEVPAEGFIHFEIRRSNKAVNPLLFFSDR